MLRKDKNNNSDSLILNNVGILDIAADNWTWYIQGADRVAKVVPTTNQQPKNIATATTLQLSDTLQTPFYLYDHLGNTRVVYNAVGTVCGSDIGYTVEYAGDYFPYGKSLREYSFGETEKFLTTQHERDTETGLDYRGARFYDSDIARFLSLDPLAADYPSLSDYSYVAGNPIHFIDPTGMSTENAGGGDEPKDKGTLPTVEVTYYKGASESFNGLAESQKNFLMLKWRSMEEGNVYKGLLQQAIYQGSENYSGWSDNSGWWDQSAQRNWESGHIGWRKNGAGSSMMRIANYGVGGTLLAVGGGSILGSMIPASSTTISISGITTFVSEVSTYGYIVGEGAVSSTVTAMSRYWLGRMAIYGGSLYTGTNLFNLRTGNYTPNIGFTSAAQQKAIIKSPILSTGNNRFIDGFYYGNFRFQMHSHRINNSANYLPHINFGTGGKYHLMLSRSGISKLGLIHKK